MDKTVKLFAFQLADQAQAGDLRDNDHNDGKWRARDGVSTAGCSDRTGDGDYRCSIYPGRDNGPWC